MNNGNSCLWILIILLLLGTCGNSRAFSGCGWPFLVAAAYCIGKNGSLSDILGRIGGNGGCGCNG